MADSSPEHPPALLGQIAPFVALVDRFREQVRNDPLAQASPIDPVHLASAIVGTTVFFVAAMPTLVPEPGFDPLRADQLAAHRREVLRIARRLLGAGAASQRASEARDPR